MTIQIGFRYHEQEGWPGLVSRPKEPHFFHQGQIYVPAGGRAPQPGDPVYYDTTQNAYALPTTAAQVLQIIGVIGYDLGTLQSALATIPANQESPVAVQYKNGDTIKVLLQGSIYGLAGAAMKYGNVLSWNTTNYDYEVAADRTLAASTPSSLANAWTALRTYVAAINYRPLVCITKTVADGDVFEMQVGSGRNF